MGYDNSNTGVLFTNEKKSNENAPDYKGKVFFGDQEKQLAGWIRKSKDGTKTFLSLKVSEKYVPDQSQNNQWNNSSSEQGDDSPPF